MSILGIDLGTSNSVVSVWDGGEAKVIQNQEGSRTTPSVVSYADEITVGEPAKRQQVTNPDKTIFSAKRFIGMPFDKSDEERKRVPYNVVKGSGNNCVFELGDKKVTPEEVGAKVLQKLKKAAEDHLGKEVAKAIITVPAYFDNAQRQATKDAGQIAGLEVLRVINEPTAAALAYGLDKKEDEKVLVVDCGGGTTDISVLEIGDNVVEVISTYGDTHLGGDDFDNALIDYVADDFKAKEGIDLRSDKMALQRLKAEVEQLKKDLSSSGESELNIPFITADANGPKHLQLKVSRAKFESLIGDLVDRIFVCADKALSDVKMKPSDIDEIVFVGGSTRIPVIAKKVEEKFGKKPNLSVNPDEIVAMGAAVQGGILAGDKDEMLLLDVTPLSLGLETLGGVMTVLIPRNTTIPTKQSQVFSTAADNQTSVTVKVAQGERKMFADNSQLATFNLDGIPPAPRGIPQIEVEFNIDANGIVNVKATDRATGADKDITIKSGLSNEDIDNMVKEAQEHKEEDEKKAKQIEELNSLDTLIFSTRKMFKDNEEQLKDKVDMEEAEKTLSEAEQVVSNRSFDEVASVSEKVTQVAHKASQELYAASQPQAQPDVTTEEPETEEVVDV